MLISKVIYYSCISFAVLKFLKDVYVNFRQYQTAKHQTTVPEKLEDIYPQELYENCRLYEMDCKRLEIGKSVYYLAVKLNMLLNNGMYQSWNGITSFLVSKGYDLSYVYTHGLFFLAVTVISLTLKDLIPNVVTNFVKRRHNRDSKNIIYFLLHEITKCCTGIIVILPVGCGLIHILHDHKESLFIPFWIFVASLCTIGSNVVNNWLLHSLETSQELPDGSLKQKIQKLCSDCQCSLGKIYLSDGMKKDLESVFIWNLLKTHIYLSNILPEHQESGVKHGINDNQITALVGHSLGHWKEGHKLKMLCYTQIFVLGFSLMVTYLMNEGSIYPTFGFTDSKPALIGVNLSFLATEPLFFIFEILYLKLRRDSEEVADAFAKKVIRSSDLKEALIKLTADFMMFPVQDAAYNMFYSENPTLLKRIELLDKSD